MNAPMEGMHDALPDPFTEALLERFEMIHGRPPEDTELDRLRLRVLLTPEEVQAARERVVTDAVGSALLNLVAEGKVEISGIGPDGENVYRPVRKPRA